jgi:hypothetical protein
MRLLETDSNANIDINAATAIGVYTATAGRLVFVRVCVDAVAGGGDYIVYVTLRLGGAGSSYRLIPLTTATAAAALTAIGFVSGAIPMDANDVLTVYIDGLAGDTTTPDTRVDYYEMDYLRPATAGRTLDVNASGAAKADLVSILGAAITGTAAWLAGAFAKFFDVETPLLDTSVVIRGTDGAFTGDADDIAAKILASPSYLIETNESGYVTTTNPGLTAQQTRDAMKLAPTAGAPAAGSIDKHLDDIEAKTNLIGGAGSMSVITPVVGGVLTFTIGASFPSTAITGLTIAAAWTKYKFTLKRNADDTDAAAILQYVVSNPAAAATDGVLVVEGAAATVAQRTLASLVVTQAAGTIALPASALLTTALSPHASLVWDMKEYTATDETIRATGTALAIHAVTWAVT